ncbi:transposase, Ptta/En/Spm [Tanacetum coccineum]
MLSTDTLILARDQLLPSGQEGERFHRLPPYSEICIFDYSSHMLFMSEFVRMAAKFGAKIIPSGVVGEDDIGEVAPALAVGCCTMVIKPTEQTPLKDDMNIAKEEIFGSVISVLKFSTLFNWTPYNAGTNFGRDKRRLQRTMHKCDHDSKEICKCSYNEKRKVKFTEHVQQRELEANAREQTREREWMNDINLVLKKFTSSLPPPP